jgi:hypothetical protein
VHFLGEPVQWVETARYLWVNLDKQFISMARFKDVEKNAAEKLGLLDPFLNRRSG